MSAKYPFHAFLDARLHFCSILTDDDWLEPGSITTTCSLDPSLETIVAHSVQAFLPRYSYTESGAHACTSCRIASARRCVSPLTR